MYCSSVHACVGEQIHVSTCYFAHTVGLEIFAVENAVSQFDVLCNYFANQMFEDWENRLTLV